MVVVIAVGGVSCNHFYFYFHFVHLFFIPFYFYAFILGGCMTFFLKLLFLFLIAFSSIGVLKRFIVD